MIQPIPEYMKLELVERQKDLLDKREKAVYGSNAYDRINGGLHEIISLIAFVEAIEETNRNNVLNEQRNRNR